jgi:hypothetical protein
MLEVVIAGRKERLAHGIEKIGFVGSFRSSRPGAGFRGGGPGPAGPFGEETAESGQGPGLQFPTRKDGP